MDNEHDLVVVGLDEAAALERICIGDREPRQAEEVSEARAVRDVCLASADHKHT